MKLYTLLILVCLLSKVIGVFGQYPVAELSNTEEVRTITKSISYFVDDTESITLEDVMRMPAEKYTQPTVDILNFKTKLVTVWMRIEMEKKIEEEHDWFLELGSPFVNHSEFYFQNENGDWDFVKEGRIYPFSERLFKQGTFFYDLPEFQGKRVFYMKFTGYYMRVPVRVGTAQAFWEGNHFRDIAYGVFYGLILIIVAYNLFLYISIRELNYLYYILFALFNGLTQFHINGHGTEFLWGDILWFNRHSAWSPGLMTIFMSLFTISFLKLESELPLYTKIFKGIIGVCISALILNVVQVHSTISSMLIQLSILVGVILILMSSYILIRRNYKPARFFFLAWLMYLLSALVFIVASLGIIEFRGVFPTFTMVGTSMEIILLSLALADKIRYYKQQNEETQQMALEIVNETKMSMKAQNEELENIIMERTEELVQINDQLKDTVSVVNEKNEQIRIHNEKIISSINYAQRIQEAVFPLPSKIATILSEYFILFSPKDIVSGDFYWVEKVGSKKIVAAVDCTGHGVSGAFMSLIGSDLLYDAVIKEGLVDPGQILAYLDSKVITLLKQGETNNKDGMDAAVCVIDEEQNQIVFSGAKNPLVLVKDGELVEYKGDKKAVGGIKKKGLAEDYITHTISLEKGTVGYMFSDGYMDQFGGEDDRKFMKKAFFSLLKEIAHLPMNEQKQVLKNRFQSWKGERSQIDDVLVIGFEC